MYILSVASQPEANSFLDRLSDWLSAQSDSTLVYLSTAEEITDFSIHPKAETIFSLDDISESPSLILGQSHLDMMIALARFPETPGVYCYTDSGWNSEPPITSQIGLYLVREVKEYNRLRHDYGIPEDRIMHELYLPNLDKTSLLSAAKPIPERALVAARTPLHLSIEDTLSRACSKRNIEVDVLDLSQMTPSLVDFLTTYDIVFACDDLAALSLTLMRVVILWHPQGAASLITPFNLDTHLQTNFRVASNFDQEITLDNLSYELAQYNIVNNISMAVRVREYYGESAVMTRVIEQLHKVEAMHVDQSPEFQARYLHWLAQSIPMKIAAEERLSAAEATRFRALYEQTLSEKVQLEHQLNAQIETRIKAAYQPLRAIFQRFRNTRLFRVLRYVKRRLLPPDSRQARLVSNIRAWMRR